MKSLPAAPSVAVHPEERLPGVVAVTSQTLPEQVNALLRARNFAEPLIADEMLDTGENTLAHADAVAAILRVVDRKSVV